MNRKTAFKSRKRRKKLKLCSRSLKIVEIGYCTCCYNCILRAARFGRLTKVNGAFSIIDVIIVFPRDYSVVKFIYRVFAVL